MKWHSWELKFEVLILPPLPLPLPVLTSFFYSNKCNIMINSILSFIRINSRVMINDKLREDGTDGFGSCQSTRISYIYALTRWTINWLYHHQKVAFVWLLIHHKYLWIFLYNVKQEKNLSSGYEDVWSNTFHNPFGLEQMLPRGPHLFRNGYHLQNKELLL